MFKIATVYTFIIKKYNYHRPTNTHTQKSFSEYFRVLFYKFSFKLPNEKIVFIKYNILYIIYY